MTNAEARFNNSLCPWKPEGSLGRTAQDVHLDSHTAPELCAWDEKCNLFLKGTPSISTLGVTCNFFLKGTLNIAVTWCQSIENVQIFPKRQINKLH